MIEGTRWLPVNVSHLLPLPLTPSGTLLTELCTEEAGNEQTRESPVQTICPPAHILLLFLLYRCLLVASLTEVDLTRGQIPSANRNGEGRRIFCVYVCV